MRRWGQEPVEFAMSLFIGPRIAPLLHVPPPPIPETSAASTHVTHLPEGEFWRVANTVEPLGGSKGLRKWSQKWYLHSARILEKLGRIESLQRGRNGSPDRQEHAHITKRFELQLLTPREEETRQRKERLTGRVCRK